MDTNGIEQFGITETSIQGADGSFTIQLSAAFTAPSLPGASSAAIPLLSLSPTIATTSGTLAGGRSIYYAISAVDSTGAEGGLSFIVQATLPPTTNTNQVTLTGFSFSSGTAGFRVYRGLNPSQLLLIDSSTSVASSYTDLGATTQLKGHRIRTTIMQISTGGWNCNLKKESPRHRRQLSAIARSEC